MKPFKVISTKNLPVRFRNLWLPLWAWAVSVKLWDIDSFIAGAVTVLLAIWTILAAVVVFNQEKIDVFKEI
jgi:hypothetical protein